MKFGVARFDNEGNFQDALSSEASDEWASRFLFICTWYTIFNFDAKPVVHSINKIMVMFELLNAGAMYEAPLVEMIEVQVEKGFAASNNEGGLGDYGNNGTV